MERSRVPLPRDCPLFQGASAELRSALRRSAEVRRVPRGGFYFKQGDRAGQLHVLVTGKVRLTWAGPGLRSVVLGFAAPPQALGIVALLSGSTRLVSAEALDESKAVVWPAGTITRLAAAHPVIAANGFRILSQCLPETWAWLRDNEGEPVHRRLARTLLRLSDALGRQVGRGAAREVAVAQKEIAALAGTTPYTANRILKHWERLGLLEARRRRVRLARPWTLLDTILNPTVSRAVSRDITRGCAAPDGRPRTGRSCSAP